MYYGSTIKKNMMKKLLPNIKQAIRPEGLLLLFLNVFYKQKHTFLKFTKYKVEPVIENPRVKQHKKIQFTQISGGSKNIVN